MLGFPLMLLMFLPVVDRSHPPSNKSATGVEIKAIVDSKLDDSTDTHIKKLYIKVPSNLHGCPCFQGNPHKLYINRKVIKCRI